MCKGDFFSSTRNRPTYILVDNGARHHSVTLRKKNRIRVFEYGGVEAVKWAQDRRSNMGVEKTT